MGIIVHEYVFLTWYSTGVGNVYVIVKLWYCFFL